MKYLKRVIFDCVGFCREGVEAESEALSRAVINIFKV